MNRGSRSTVLLLMHSSSDNKLRKSSRMFTNNISDLCHSCAVHAPARLPRAFQHREPMQQRGLCRSQEIQKGKRPIVCWRRWRQCELLRGRRLPALPPQPLPPSSDAAIRAPRTTTTGSVPGCTVYRGYIPPRRRGISGPARTRKWWRCARAPVARTVSQRRRP